VKVFYRLCGAQRRNAFAPAHGPRNRFSGDRAGKRLIFLHLLARRWRPPASKYTEIIDLDQFIARAHSDDEVEHLRGLGADTIIMAEREIARGIVEEVITGDAAAER
jgi:voltage-gated potassium channel Kch